MKTILLTLVFSFGLVNLTESLQASELSSYSVYYNAKLDAYFVDFDNGLGFKGYLKKGENGWTYKLFYDKNLAIERTHMPGKNGHSTFKNASVAMKFLIEDYKDYLKIYQYLE